MNKANLQPLSTAKQLLVEFILILTVSYHPPTTMIHASLYECFWICLDWTKFHLELVKLIDAFKSNCYPENFINNCLKTFLDNKLRIQEKVITDPKKPLLSVLPYLGPLSLITRTKLRKSLKDILSCCKLQIVFKESKQINKHFSF